MSAGLLKWKITCFICFVSTFLFVGLGNSQETEIEKYPTRPITFISPLPAGTSSDSALRLIAKEAEKFLGKPIVVINKTGGSHTIGVVALATSKPDGYTIGYVTPSPLFTIPFLEKLPYHPIKDLQQIIQYGEVIFGATIKPDAPFKNFKEMIAFARQNPKKVTYGTGGARSIANITFEKIAKDNGVQFTHIPFKGGADTQTALLGGHILFATGEVNASLVDAGQIKPLVIFTEKHPAEYPEIPILKDVGYEISYPTLLAVTAPKGLPEGIAKKLEDAFSKAMKEPAFIKGMRDLRFPILYRDSRELTDYVVQNYAVYEKLMKELGFTK